MNNIEVSTATTLLEALMATGGFPTNTRARKAIKGGFVTVDGVVNRIPSTQLNPGSKLVYRQEKPAKAPDSFRDFNLGGASKTALNTPSPFEIVYEDDAVLAYIKPAGWVFASPNPKVKTAYTRMKDWMATTRPECRDVHFVNRIEKESSGICFIAKDLQWRVHLQKHWNQFERGLYVVVEGHLPPDDEVFALQAVEGSKKRERLTFPYRTMRATATHTLLKFQLGFEHIPALMSGLRRMQCLVIGKGESAPNPLGRSGLHLYQVAIEGPEGQIIETKTRVPREFLNLLKGGKGPRARSAKELEADKRKKQQSIASGPREDAPRSSRPPRPQGTDERKRDQVQVRKSHPSESGKTRSEFKKGGKPERKGKGSDLAPRRFGPKKDA